MAVGLTLIRISSPKLSKGLAALTKLTRSSHPIQCLAVVPGVSMAPMYYHTNRENAREGTVTKKEQCCNTLRWARASSNLARCLVAAALLVAGAAPPARSGEDWPEILPEELALKEDPNSPGAHAIILDREVHTDDVKGFETYYYRIKIFTEKGKKYADIEIPYLEKQQQVEDIQARTVRPDGTVVDFGGRIFDKVLVKVKKLRYQAKTITLPEVQ